MKKISLNSLAQHRKLRLGLAFACAMVAMGLLSSLAVAQYQIELQTQQQAAARTGHTLGQAVQDRLAQAMLSNEREHIADILTVARDYPDVRQVVVVGPNGHVYLSTGTPRADDTAPLTTPGCVECHRLPVGSLPTTTLLKFKADQVRAATPITFSTSCNSCHLPTGQAYMGVILVDISLTGVEARAQNSLIESLVLIGLGSLAMGALIYWLLGSRSIQRPIIRRPLWRLKLQHPSAADHPSGRRYFFTKRVPIILGSISIVIILSGGIFVTRIENTNEFCASCHTQPETTFYQRSQAAPADLASMHATQKVACVECHNGSGLSGRVGALGLGAKNLAAYLSGQYHQPALMLFKFDAASCVKCHASQLVDNRQANHFHFYLSSWQQTDPANAATCAACHTGHLVSDQTNQHYIDRAAMTPVCNSCHDAARNVAAWPAP